jgi:hypothetical protein
MDGIGGGVGTAGCARVTENGAGDSMRAKISGFGWCRRERPYS